MYDNAKYHHTLTKTQKTLPLQILAPDTDEKTAMTLSLEKQHPRSFEIMIEMLKGFQDKCLTKMMLDSMSIILQHHSPNVIDFLDSCIYQPPQMKINQFVHWNDDFEEVVFACNTSVIHDKMLRNVIKKSFSKAGSVYQYLIKAGNENDDSDDENNSDCEEKVNVKTDLEKKMILSLKWSINLLISILVL